jgi:hypothetical protein
MRSYNRNESDHKDENTYQAADPAGDVVCIGVMNVDMFARYLQELLIGIEQQGDVVSRSVPLVQDLIVCHEGTGVRCANNTDDLIERLSGHIS